MPHAGPMLSGDESIRHVKTYHNSSILKSDTLYTYPDPVSPHIATDKVRQHVNEAQTKCLISRHFSLRRTWKCWIESSSRCWIMYDSRSKTAATFSWKLLEASIVLSCQVRWFGLIFGVSLFNLDIAIRHTPSRFLPNLTITHLAGRR